MSRLIEPLITAEDVYEATNQGLDVFEAEIEDFSICRNVKNPFESDKNPSARIKQSRKSGIWILNIYNSDGGYYTAIAFIQKKYGLDFRGAIDYIMNKKELSPIITQNKPKTAKNSSISYDFEPISYTQEHINYFKKGELDEEFLTKEMDIYAISRYAINKNIKYPKKGEIMFAYEHKNIEGKPTNKLKLLTLGKYVEKSQKWRNNINPTEFFYTHKIQDNNLVFLGKSNKDCAITEKLGITSIAALSENRANIAEGLKNLISLYPKTNFILNLGSDFQAKQVSVELSKEFNLKWFNIENRFLTSNINDNFGFVESFGMEALKKQLKRKGFL